MTREMRTRVVAALRRTQLAEVCWVGPDGRPDASVVVPLLRDDRPCLALHYGRRELTAALLAAETVWLTVATPAVARGAEPVGAIVRFELEHDPEGARFVDEGLCDQELAKHPPSRRRLEHRVARREHWWYAARMLLTATSLTRATGLPVADGLLAVAEPDGLTVDAVELPDPAAPVTAGERLEVADRRAGEAVLLSHGAEVPALETRWQRRVRGAMEAASLHAREVELLPPRAARPGLWERLRAERELRRACVQGLRAPG